MFPNIRLMVAATIASIVVLSCGFGVFATFRVSHEPLGRLPTGTLPLQIVSDRMAPPAVTLAVGWASGSRFESSETQISGAAARLQVLKPDRGDGTALQAVSTTGSVPESEPAADTAPQIASEPEPTTDRIPQTASQSEAAVDTAPQPGSEQVPVPASEAAVPVAATSTDAAGQESQAPAAERDAKTDGIADTTGASPVAALDSAPVDQQASQAQPVEHATVETPVAPKTAINTPRKIVRRVRVAAKTHRARKLVTRAVAQSPEQNFAFSQPNFQSAPQPEPQPVRPQRLVKRFRSAKRVIAESTIAKRTAVGGPFVSPPAP